MDLRFGRFVIVCCWMYLAADVVVGQEWPDPVAHDVVPLATTGVSHGPLLGQITSHSVRVWLRTLAPTEFKVVYSTRLPLRLDSAHAVGETRAASDCTGHVMLRDLKANTRYFYGIVIDGQLADLRMAARSRSQVGSDTKSDWPSFQTLPNQQSFRDAELNPNGLFNLSFAIGHCASQQRVASGGQYASTPAFDSMAKHAAAGEAMFAIVNGDIIYEENRDGTLAGVRQNYKTYFERGRSFSHLFRSTPALFTFDDHDVGWDIHGCGEVGLGKGRHLIRDTGLRAYEEFASWANYRGPQSGRIRFGSAQTEQGSGILTDPGADFTTLRPDQVSTIHLDHYTRSMTGRRKTFSRSAGVYGLVRVLDKHRLEIEPAARSTEELSYSIGAHHYYDWKLANCHFFALDTRGERSSRNPKDRKDPKLFLLSDAQERWLLRGAKQTDADFIVLISPDPWTIYHTAHHVGGDDKDDKGDGFPSFLHQRTRLLAALDAIGKPVVIFTGDVHASASVRVTKNIWEMMCGPLGSTGHPIGTLGNPPRGGRWNSMGHPVDIRWVAGFPNDLPYQRIRNTYYGIVQINNVLKVGSPQGAGARHVAYDRPQMVVRWHDGYTGKLVYAESILATAIDSAPIK